MPGSWEFLAADATERETFAGRAAVLALPHEIAAPPNRQRRVHRVLHQGRIWFFKEFGPTQWRNRLRFRLRPPHAEDDAEREALMTLALRAAGVETPRPVARGRDRLGSCYLCAELPGRSLRELLQRGGVSPGALQLVAGFCGEILAKGFHLPDLSAEHVFVRQEIGFLHLGLLDLHNGSLAPPGPVPQRLCRRVLRHFARSVQDLPVPRLLALRFAARLLRNAGRGRETRRLLQQLPPSDTAWRYERQGRSRAYAARSPRRQSRELELLARVWPGRPGESVLDVPCGTGRLLPFLRRRGHGVLWADGALAMLRQARDRNGDRVPSLQAHALALPLADRSVDGIVQFRFLHHLPPQAARAALTEACRVARRFVVLTFFHPCSAHHLQRRLRGLLTRRAAARHALTLGRLDRWCRAHGFRRTAACADLPFARDLWLAAYERPEATAPAADRHERHERHE